MNIKKAFTLAEALIVFVIIGIIISLGVSSVKPWEKAFKYSYIRTYNSLAMAVYNHMINVSKNTTAFPEDSNEFCSALLEYINTAGSPDEYKDTNGKYKCKNSPIKSAQATAFRPTDEILTKENFKASNGVKFWISANASGKPYEYTAKEHIVRKDSEGNEVKDADGNKIEYDVEEAVKFYIVYADLNGDRKPNTSQWTSDKMSDIVAFIVTDKYAVIPIGYPEVDSRYMEARVVYPSWDSSGDEDTNAYEDGVEITSDAMTYYEAKIHAYDMDKDGAISEIVGTQMTYDFNSSKEIKNLEDYHIGTYNDYYETAPAFNPLQCNSDGYTEPVCTVKIYDYQ